MEKHSRYITLQNITKYYKIKGNIGFNYCQIIVKLQIDEKVK